MIKRFLPALTVASILTACATNPATGKREISFMSEDKEIAIGRELDQEVRQQMGLYQDEELQRYVSELGMDLARRSQRPNLPWSFAVVDSPAVNAWGGCRGGGVRFRGAGDGRLAGRQLREIKTIVLA